MKHPHQSFRAEEAGLAFRLADVCPPPLNRLPLTKTSSIPTGLNSRQTSPSILPYHPFTQVQIDRPYTSRVFSSLDWLFLALRSAEWHMWRTLVRHSICFLWLDRFVYCVVFLDQPDRSAACHLPEMKDEREIPNGRGCSPPLVLAKVDVPLYIEPGLLCFCLSSFCVCALL